MDEYNGNAARHEKRSCSGCLILRVPGLVRHYCRYCLRSPVGALGSTPRVGNWYSTTVFRQRSIPPVGDATTLGGRPHRLHRHHRNRSAYRNKDKSGSSLAPRPKPRLSGAVHTPDRGLSHGFSCAGRRYAEQSCGAAMGGRGSALPELLCRLRNEPRAGSHRRPLPRPPQRHIARTSNSPAGALMCR